MLTLDLIFSTCAIIGGVLTVAGLVDSMIFSSRKRLSGANGAEGFGSREGKMVSLYAFPWCIESGADGHTVIIS
jgi:hypothetical protein